MCINADRFQDRDRDTIGKYAQPKSQHCWDSCLTTEEVETSSLVVLLFERPLPYGTLFVPFARLTFARGCLQLGGTLASQMRLPYVKENILETPKKHLFSSHWSSPAKAPARLTTLVLFSGVAAVPIQRIPKRKRHTFGSLIWAPLPHSLVFITRLYMFLGICFCAAHSWLTRH